MKRLLQQLEKREKEGTLRSLHNYEGKIDFLSNFYLFKETQAYPQSNAGSGGSRLLYGTSQESLECESFLAEHFQIESALVFASGYVANLSLLSTLPQKGDTIIYDEHIHASMRDGLRLSHAKSFKFQHNSPADLELKLNKAEGEVYVLVESLYSMGGDMAPLKQVLDLCERFNAHLIVDEAHAVGVFGDQGKGIVSCMPDAHKVFARVVTFGKAYGWHGAAVLGSENLKKVLLNFARPFIYSTALPPSDYTEIVRRITLPLDEPRNCLQENLSFFRSGSNLALESEENSPIQIIRFDSLKQLQHVELELGKRNLAARAIYPPTVAPGNELLRICVHAHNTKQEISFLNQVLNQAG